MKNQKWKAILICIVMLAAGVCYSCRRTDFLYSDQEIVLESADFEEHGSLEDHSMPVESVQESRQIVIYVCGAVCEPGVYELPADSRIYAAIEAAGGFTEEAAVDYWNQAEILTDGKKLYIPTYQELREKGELSDENMEPGGSITRININTASKEQLMTLKGIGEARAEDIIQYREKYGYFQKTEDIMKISGIKEAAFEKIKDSITI